MTTRLATTTITVQFDIEYDRKYVQISDVSADLARIVGRTQEPKPVRDTDNDVASWWTRVVRTFDEALEPIGFATLSAAFDHIGMALDEFDDGEITVEQLVEALREQVGEREASR